MGMPDVAKAHGQILAEHWTDPPETAVQRGQDVVRRFGVELLEEARNRIHDLGWNETEVVQGILRDAMRPISEMIRRFDDPPRS